MCVVAAGHSAKIITQSKHAVNIFLYMQKKHLVRLILYLSRKDAKTQRIYLVVYKSYTAYATVLLKML